MGTFVRSAFQHKSLASPLNTPGQLNLINKKALFVAARFIIDNQMNPVKNHRNSENWLILRVSLPRKKGLDRYFSCPLIPRTKASAFHRPSALFFSAKHSVSRSRLMSRKNCMISCKNLEKGERVTAVTRQALRDLQPKS